MLPDSMMGQEEGAKGKVAVPSEKVAWLESPSLCTKGFIITNLLGPEAELQLSLVTTTIAEGTGSWVVLGSGTLLLGLGFLCEQPYLLPPTPRPILPAALH